MSGPVRVVIVGTGTAARLHVEALRSLDEHVQIVAGVGDDAGHAAEFCAEHRIPHADTDIAAAMAEVSPALVHVCVSDAAEEKSGENGNNERAASAGHAEGLTGDAAAGGIGGTAAVIAALNAGVHVVVDVPVALTLRELDDVDAAQGPHGPFAAMVFPLRSGSGARRLRALVGDGVLGRPLLAVCHTFWFRGGGRSTMGPGIHQMDLLVSVLGEWTEVSAVAHRLAQPGSAEDVSLAHVTFAAGAVAGVVNSGVSPREENYLRIDFERASVELTHGPGGYGDEDWRITPAPGHESAVLAAWKAGEQGRRSGLASQFADVLARLRAGERPPVGVDDARVTMRLVAGVYASAYTGRPVVPSDLEPGSAFYERLDGFGPPWM